MTTASPTRPDEELDTQRIGAITELLLQGRRVHEVVAHGLARRPGWRRNHVVDLIAEKGWTLDSDGRVPRALRTSTITPVTRLPGAPTPEPPRTPVAEWPERGTVTAGPRATPPAAAIVAAGKQHEVAAIRRLAEKAEKALDELAAALREDGENAKLRARLAEIEAEAERLRDRLRGSGKKKEATPGRRGGNRPVRPETLAKPIAHGTWGGFLAHSKRHQPVPDGDPCGCLAAKNEHMDKLRAKSSRGGGRNG